MALRAQPPLRAESAQDATRIARAALRFTTAEVAPTSGAASASEAALGAAPAAAPLESSAAVLATDAEQRLPRPALVLAPLRVLVAAVRALWHGLALVHRFFPALRAWVSPAQAVSTESSREDKSSAGVSASTESPRSGRRPRLLPGLFFGEGDYTLEEFPWGPVPATPFERPDSQSMRQLHEFLGYSPRRSVLDLERPPRPSSARILEACTLWRLRLQDIEAAVIPQWGLDWSFSCRTALITYLHPWPTFNPGDVVRYWSERRKTWTEAIVVRQCRTWISKSKRQEFDTEVEGSWPLVLYELDNAQRVEPWRLKHSGHPASAASSASAPASASSGKAGASAFLPPSALALPSSSARRRLRRLRKRQMARTAASQRATSRSLRVAGGSASSDEDNSFEDSSSSSSRSSSSESSDASDDEGAALPFGSDVASMGGRLIGEALNCEFTGPHGDLCRSIRWAELLTGCVVTRMMSDPYPTMNFSSDPSWADGVLQSLRCMPWSAESHWVFPPDARLRMLFLSWIGKVLGMNPIWNMAVLPFVDWRIEKS
eukprot:TRINITY_DN30362_c0_g3_i1.p1 TRINITY_DN30362_c0_g3~~TRINITY_DN30362_c0_g3_i1.p1  ORF type:complete len:546 (-),score=71.74 TRINITY_DN30362_c0_g3_i1:25-1662(-)